MKKEDAIYFAGLMEDYLHIPFFLSETIEKDLSDGKYKEVIEYIIQRKRELEESSYFKTIEEMPKVSLMVNEDTKGIELYRFIINNMKFSEVMDLYTSLKYKIEYSTSLKDRCCCNINRIELKESE